MAGAIQRDRKVVAGSIRGISRLHLNEFVNTNVELNAKVFTNDHARYNKMSGYDHKSLHHSVGEYVDAIAHTNGIESFWAMLKRGYHGTFQPMSEKHLHCYVNEFPGWHNIRSRDILDRMVAIVCGLVGKRLRYQDLVAE